MLNLRPSEAFEVSTEAKGAQESWEAAVSNRKGFMRVLHSFDLALRALSA